jgi:hypothetical protein
MEFLEKNDLYFEESYTKKELLEVLKTKTFAKQYEADIIGVMRYFVRTIARDEGTTKSQFKKEQSKFSEQTIDLEEVFDDTKWAILVLKMVIVQNKLKN